MRSSLSDATGPPGRLHEFQFRAPGLPDLTTSASESDVNGLQLDKSMRAPPYSVIRGAHIMVSHTIVGSKQGAGLL